MTNITKRISSIDLLRGIIMIIMALDHVRDFVHIHGMDDAPTNLATTSPVLFFTRFITHYCAPTFIFLSGTSIFLQAQRKTQKELSSFLLKRGLWLMFLEVAVVNLFMTFNPLYNFFMLQVIWVIGLSMVFMSVIIYLPFSTILGIALLMIIGHNWFDRFSYPNQPPLWFSLLHQQGFYSYAPQHGFGVMYPLIPWVGVMMLGYCSGKWYVKSYTAEIRRKNLMKAGIAALVVFVVLRYTNLYGDAAKWSEQPRGTIYSIISFFNVSKYPPSLLYLCITLGPSLIALSFLEKAKGTWINVCNVFGRVPLFYYLCHFLLAHLITVVLFFASGKTVHDIADPNAPFLFRPEHWGYPLWVVYLVWIMVIAILYPVCKKYDNYKSTHKKWWLSYL